MDYPNAATDCVSATQRISLFAEHDFGKRQNVLFAHLNVANKFPIWFMKSNAR